VSSSDFAAAKCDTGFIDRSLSRLLTSPIRFPFVALATAALLQREEKNARVENADPYSPWTRTSGWRLNGEYSRSVHWRTANQRVETNLTYARKGYLLKACGQSALISIIERQDNEFALLADTDRIAGHVYMHGNDFAVVAAGEQIGLHWVDPMGGGLHAEHEEGSLSAPMPGKIVAVLVKNGQAVSKGTPLITMEAMKMEHTIAAVADGVVDEVLFNVGDQVTEGTQLLRFSPNNS
jgi:3-methylcrotonyl-CoA carboxylase alpha subunit